MGTGFWIASQVKNTSDPEEIAALAAGLERFALPTTVKPHSATQAPFGMKAIVYSERPILWKSKVMIGLLDLPQMIAPNERQARYHVELQGHILRGSKSESKHVHIVTVNGKDVEIVEEERTDENNNRFRNLSGLFPKSEGFIAAVVSLKRLPSQPDSDAAPAYALTTDEALAFFASYRAPTSGGP